MERGVNQMTRNKIDAPTVNQLNCIRIIEQNLPGLDFRGTTFREAQDFIAAHKSSSEAAAYRKTYGRQRAYNSGIQVRGYLGR